MNKITFACGHTYPWVLSGKNGNCAYCDGEYPDGTKCSGASVKNKSMFNTGGTVDYKKFYDDISTNVEMMVTKEMRMHACADPVYHDLSFQIFRLLSGYSEALEELNNLR